MTSRWSANLYTNLLSLLLSLETIAGDSAETVAGDSRWSQYRVSPSASDRSGCELFDVPDYGPVQSQRRTAPVTVTVRTPTLRATSPSRATKR